METWIAMETDAILLGTNDPNAVIGIISQAIDAGIPVIAGVSNDAPDSDRLLFVGFGAPETGVSLAKALLAMLELEGVSPPGKISFHLGTLGTTEDVASWDAFREVIEAAGYEAIEPIVDGGDAAIASALAEETIALYPDLVGMAGRYDYTGPAIAQVLEDAGKTDQIAVIATGLTGAVAPFFETGAVDALVDTAQYDASYLAGEILYKLTQAGSENWDDILKEYCPGYPANSEIVTKLGLITAEKVDIEKWDEVGWIMTVEENQVAYPDVWDVIR